MTPDADDIIQERPSQTVLQILYAGSVIVAALYFGRELVVPLVLASLLAFVLAPACGLLERLRLPRVAAVMIVVLLTFAVIGGLGTIVGRQAAILASSLPSYESTVMEKVQALTQGDGLMARLVRGALPAANIRKEATDSPAKAAAQIFKIDEGSSLSIARTLALPFLGPLETGAVVLVFTIFILLSSDDLRDRLVRLVGRRDLHRTILAMNDAARRLSQYFVYQLALNTSFGVIVGCSLWFAGLPNPLLWGILSALMRFVPYIGVFIALAPPLLLALAVVPGWFLAIVVLALFLGAEAIMGQAVEPLIYGHSTGLSPLAVIVATAFWALLWGPIGLLIATPLTVCLVVIGRHVEALAFLEIILGDKAPLEPSETFYQRALEGHALQLAPVAQNHIKTSSLTDYFDKVALPGLALAQKDLLRDSLGFERLEAIHEQIETLLGRLETTRVEGATSRPVPDLAPEWSNQSIICVPGRGQLDDLAATMAVKALDAAGFGARLEPNLVLGARDANGLDGIRLCCLSILEDGSSVSGIRYFIRRIEKRMPQAIVVVGLWHADRDSPMLSVLRSEGHNEHLVMSVGELVALTKTLASRKAPLSFATQGTSLPRAAEQPAIA